MQLGQQSGHALLQLGHELATVPIPGQGGKGEAIRGGTSPDKAPGDGAQEGLERDLRS